MRTKVDIHDAGFVLVPGIVSDSLQSTVVEGLQSLPHERSTRRGRTYAARNILALPSVCSLAETWPIREIVEPVLGPDAFPVRGILFDKVPGANWHVGWHQDQIIAVAERKEVPGFTAWSVKGGVPHVRPPECVLEKMLTLRIHLDDCTRNNGALCVIPGSHRSGLLEQFEIDALVASRAPVVCDAECGTALAMRPLLLHASSPAASPTHRRVVHLEFAAEPLPGGLEWPAWT
jgi:hypothetical protein